MGYSGEPVGRVAVVATGELVLPSQPNPVRAPERKPAPSR